MKRNKPLRRRTALAAKPLDRKAVSRILQENPAYRREEREAPGARGWTQRVFTLYGGRCAVCGDRAVQAHHVVPKRTILARADPELAYDARNGCPVCLRCHERHETATRRIPRAKLPLGCIMWAEAFGFDWYIERIYPEAS